MTKTTYKCSICQLPLKGKGNNAWPINDGRCCDSCNDLVLGARINLAYADKVKLNEFQSQTFKRKGSE